MIDEIDGKILALLQADGRLSNAAIADEVGLTTSTVYDRVKKLEKKGIIKKYVAVVDPEAVGKSITAFVRLVIGSPSREAYFDNKQDFLTVCKQETAVLEIHTIAGDDCYILKVRVSTPQELESLLERLRSHTYISRTTSNIVLSTIKEEMAIDL